MSYGYHVAWLTRLPILHREHHHPPALAKALLAIEVPWAGAPLRLWATHLASRHDRQTPEGEIGVILDFLRAANVPLHLLVGDLNALRPGDPVGAPPPGVAKRGEACDGAPRRAIGRLLDAGYVDGYRALHPDDRGLTFPAGDPHVRLDYVFLPSAFAPRLKGCAVVNGTPATMNASDHLPVVADLDLA